MVLLRLFLILFILKGVVSGPEIVIVTSNGPTIIDSKITFFARLEKPQHENYEVAWSENIPLGRSFTENLNKTNDYKSNWTLEYPSQRYYPGQYDVTTNVGYLYLKIFWTKVATIVTFYEITSNFTGVIDISQNGTKVNPAFVSTFNETILNANIHDPAGYLKTAQNISYTWYNSTSLLLNSSSPILRQNLTKGGDYTYNVSIIALFNTTDPDTNATIIKTKTGSFSTKVSAKVPIVNFSMEGVTWFPHGKLLDLKISCDGTGPFSYCWSVLVGPYNSTGNETCRDSTIAVTNDCEFEIIWYFQDSGIYSLLTIIDNEVTHLVNKTTVNVYKVNRKQQLSIIVVPLSFTIIALVLVVFGVAYYFESNRLSVEVADFDFGQDKESPFGITFWGRVREAIENSWLFSHYQQLGFSRGGSGSGGQSGRNNLIPRSSFQEDEPPTFTSLE